MMVIRLEKTALARALGYHASEANLAAGPSGESFDIECPIALRRRGKETRIVLADKSRRTA